MIDKKIATILALIVLLVITGVGWFIDELKPHGGIPYDDTYTWTEYFRGYEAYLDRSIRGSVVSGISMIPTFREGDMVLWVEIDNKAELKVGDIIIFKDPTKPADNVVHRIIATRIQEGEYQFKAKGDSESESSQWIPEGNVHGLVIGVIYQGSS